MKLTNDCRPTSIPVMVVVLLASMCAMCAACDTGDDADTDAPTEDASVPGAERDGGPPTGDAAADSGMDPPVSCPTPSVKAGSDETSTLKHDGLKRSYTMHVGASVNTAEATPLVVNFHGLTNTPSEQANFSNMDSKADEAGFVVVYPQGIDASFNAGSCCGTSDADDVGFALAVIEDVATRLCVDPRRIYATGFSNGGFMAHRLACEHADVFAAVASVAGAMGIDGCKPSRAISVMGVHHPMDPVIEYGHGREAIDEWAGLLSCKPKVATETFGDDECEVWRGCDAESEVRFCTWNANLYGHLWPADFPATDEIWEFFERHPLTGAL